MRAGVGAVATQANTRTEYGNELLDWLAQGLTAPQALGRAVAADTGAARRQVGVIGLKAGAGSAQHTGERTNPWAGHRAGANYVTQGNLLVGPEVLAAVAQSFESTAASDRHLADRLIEALAAGHAPGRSRRSDGITANINVCEHPDPVAELRRIYDTISQTLGFRTLEQFTGADVWQLKVILHALGYFRSGAARLEQDREAFLYTSETVAAIDAFRQAEGLSTPAMGSPPGLVDRDTAARLWAALARAGKAEAVRRELKEVTAVRR